MTLAYLKKLVDGQSLKQKEAAEMMKDTMEGKLVPAQIASLLTALKIKGETAAEISGMAQVMRSMSRKVKYFPDAVDTCGTGGDGLGTFNVSTTAALIVAGAGVKVAKHGNRSVTSRCGSADLLEALGIRIEQEPDEVVRNLNSYGFAFLYAPLYHGAMRHAATPRRELGFRTAFNLLGPLTNPAGVKRQVIGVPAPEFLEKIAEACVLLKAEHTLVIHGGDGSDELSLSGENLVLEVKDGSIKEMPVNPRSLGLSAPSSANTGDIRGGSTKVNAAITRKVLSGHKGPARDISLLNAAAALLVSGKMENLEQGLELASHSLDRGEALNLLGKLQSNESPPKAL